MREEYSERKLFFGKAFKQGQSLVGDECHHVALALDRPQLQRKRCSQGMVYSEILCK
jgi:hypothetical protein